MDSITKLNIVKLMREMNNQPLEYGKLDCNLMVLKMFEPDKYDDLVGRYKTVVGGARVANKAFGYNRIDDYMEENPSYVAVNPSHVQFGDIIFSDHDRVAMVALSTDSAFAINPNTNTFMECTISIPESYKIFRRI